MKNVMSDALQKNQEEAEALFLSFKFWSWACVFVTFSPVLRENKNSGEKGMVACVQQTDSYLGILGAAMKIVMER